MQHSNAGGSNINVYICLTGPSSGIWSQNTFHKASDPIGQEWENLGHEFILSSYRFTLRSAPITLLITGILRISVSIRMYTAVVSHVPQYLHIHKYSFTTFPNTELYILFRIIWLQQPCVRLNYFRYPQPRTTLNSQLPTLISCVQSYTSCSNPIILKPTFCVLNPSLPEWTRIGNIPVLWQGYGKINTAPWALMSWRCYRSY